MTEKPSLEGVSGREEENGDAPMERFRNLARRLVTVAPEKVAEEQARYEEDEDKKRRPRLSSS